jgi:uroporphyrinogen-III synthase
MAIESTGVSWDTDSTPVATTIYIFTSVNAVRHGLSGMTQGSESSLVQVIAVGLRTRIALADAGIQASSPVREDSEGILELLEATYNMPTHAVIIKGEGGSRLPERGVIVTQYSGHDSGLLPSHLAYDFD